MNQPITQSSLFGDLISSYAVDGKTSTYSHTTREMSPWLKMDMGQLQNISTVVIVNVPSEQTHNSEMRLRDFVIGVSTTDVQPTINPQNYPSCFSYEGVFASDGKFQKLFHCDPSPIMGRYVIIQMRVSEYLHLVEVEVYSDYLVDLAVGKNTFALNEEAACPSMKAVDTQPFSQISEGFCFQSSRITFVDHPWWAVDMGVPSVVNAVKIVKATSCQSCGPLEDFYIGVSDTSPVITSPTIDQNVNVNYPICVHYDRIQTTESALYNCDPEPRIGRYVIIQNPGTETLTLCEVSVYQI